MAYVAHAAVQLANDESPYEKNVWHFIKQNDSIEYRWKFCNDFLNFIVNEIHNTLI